MEFVYHAEVDSFYKVAADFLLAREEENNLPIGIIEELRGRGAAHFGYEHVHFATVHEGDEVVMAALQTAPFSLVLPRGREDAVDYMVEGFFDKGVSLPGVRGVLPSSRQFAQRWAARHDLPVREGRATRIYSLRKVILPQGVPGRLRLANQQDIQLLADWTNAFHTEAGVSDPIEVDRTVRRRVSDGALYFWEDGRSVSMAGWRGATPRGVRIALVYTPPEFRRRGYASACTAALSQHLLDSGRSFCTLFTDLANPTSNSIYQKIGYQPVADYAEFWFNGTTG